MLYLIFYALWPQTTFRQKILQILMPKVICDLYDFFYVSESQRWLLFSQSMN